MDDRFVSQGEKGADEQRVNASGSHLLANVGRAIEIVPGRVIDGRQSFELRVESTDR